MAAYAATVTLHSPKALKLANGLACIRGRVDITNYNTVLAEIAGITKRFKGEPTVIIGGMTTNGYGCSWVPASKSIKCWEDNEAAAYTADQPFGEVAVDVNAGSVEFVAFGVAP